MTIETDNAARALRQELHDWNINNDPTLAYSTIADVIDIIDRSEQILVHIESAARRATGSDDGQSAETHVLDLESDLLDAKNRLASARSTLGLAHTTIGHLKFPTTD